MKMKPYSILFLAFFSLHSAIAASVLVTKDGITKEVPAADLSQLAIAQHEHSSFCGGFVTSFEGEEFNQPALKRNELFLNYSINRAVDVQKLLPQVSEARLLSTNIWFSSYETRHYLSSTGTKAMQDLGNKWMGMTKHLNFASIEFIKHKGFNQPSVVLTFQGVTNDTIIIGGHGDSINKDKDSINAPAPGSDDNASGISVITELIHILANNDYRPHNTIKFMAYAAEEVGLIGSMDISGRFDAKEVSVLGVMQFDGTNYKGSKDLAMVLVSDGTSPEQNKFVGTLIDTYLKVGWRYDECGYACSDSYSWTYRGYPASFPAESRIKEENPRIHTADDTIETSKNSSAHSVNFVKLGLSFIVELDK